MRCAREQTCAISMSSNSPATAAGEPFSTQPTGEPLILADGQALLIRR
jgi:hypothetical protein